MMNRSMRSAVRASCVALLGSACASAPTAPPPAPATTQLTLYRDTWGVPHIYGDSEEAGFYGLGYAQAQDRLPELLAGALWVQGRRAEILGDADLPSDIEMRRWRHYEEAQTGFARLSPQLQKNYRAFIAGVKRYTADHPDRVPKWAPELNPEILVAVSRAIYWVGYNQDLGPADCAKSGVTLQLGADGRGPEVTQRVSNEWLGGTAARRCGWWCGATASWSLGRCMRSASRPRRGRISATRCHCLAGASASPRCLTATT